MSDAEAEAAVAQATVATSSFPATSIVCWGDSLSQHMCKPPNASQVGFADLDVTGPSPMQRAMDEVMPGWTVVGRGVGSETSTEVAVRQGARVLYATFPGNVIPANLASVPVSIALPQGDFGIIYVPVTIAGVPGLLRRTDQIVDEWKFTPSQPLTSPLPVAANTRVVVPQGDNGVRDLPAIYWVGRNNGGNPEQIKSDIAAMVANHNPNVPYFVVSLTPWWNETIDTEGYQKRKALNDYLRATYGSHFIDVEAYLADRALFDAGIMPTQADRIASANGTNPPSLTLTPVDTIHFNDLGRFLIAKYIARIIKNPTDEGLRNFSPVGDLAPIPNSDGTVTVIGWAFDPSDHYASTRVTLTVDGKTAVGPLTASLPSDYLAAYGVPGQHAYITQFRPGPGTHEICANVTNIGHGQDKVVKCANVTVAGPTQNQDPQGDFTIQAARNAVTVVGWGFDASNLGASIQFLVTNNGTPMLLADGNLPSPYLFSYGVPGQHAFLGQVPASNGANTVCVTAINIGSGVDTLLGCKTIGIAVVPVDPFGSVDLTMTSSGTISMTGWAVDLDAPTSPVSLIVTANDAINTFVLANTPSPQLGAYGIFGQHGFAATIRPPTSPVDICVYAVSIGPGSLAQLGCAKFNVGNYQPIGSLTAQLNKSGTITVNAWAIDFSAPNSPTSIVLFNNGVYIGTVRADDETFSLAYLFNWPVNHGMTQVVSPVAGTNTICGYAINLGQGSQVGIGCSTVVVNR